MSSLFLFFFFCYQVAKIRYDMNFKYSICIGLHTYFILLLEALFMSWDFLVNGWIYIPEPEGKRGSLAN